MNVHSDVRVEGSIGKLKGNLGHDSYDNLDDFFERFVRFTRWGGMNAAKNGKKASFFRLLLNPVARFFRMYIIQIGFLDGKAGLINCLLASCSVVAKFARLWEIEETKRKEDLKDAANLSEGGSVQSKGEDQ